MRARRLRRGAAVVGAYLVATPPAYAHAVDSVRAEAVAELCLGIALVVFGALYARGLYRVMRSARDHRARVVRCGMYFATGWSVLAVAFLSPLTDATRGLFSAHMMQHELIMLIGAPLMVLGRPLALFAWALPRSWRRGAARPFRSGAVRAAWGIVSSPLGASILHGAAIWLWHVPRFFEAAEASIAAHTLQHATFLFSALLFWWALLRPGRDQARIGSALLCLFVTMLHTSALGVLLAFSETLWYPLSTSSAAEWGLTAVEDQQLGGLIMWVPGGAAYVFVALVIAARCLAPDAPGARRAEAGRRRSAPALVE